MTNEPATTTTARADSPKRPARRRVWVSTLWGWLVGTPLVVSGLIHLSNPWFFLEAVLEYQIVGGVAARVIAALIMASSVVLGIAVIFFRSLTRPALFLIGLLYLVFVMAQISAVARGLTIACGCFGPTNHQVGWSSIFLAAVLCLLSFTGFWWEKRTDGYAEKRA